MTKSGSGSIALVGGLWIEREYFLGLDYVTLNFICVQLYGRTLLFIFSYDAHSKKQLHWRLMCHPLPPCSEINHAGYSQGEQVIPPFLGRYGFGMF